MAGLHSDLEQLHSSYNTFVNHGNDDDESDNESPPFFYGSGQPTSNWYQQQAQNTDDDDHHLPKLKNTKPHESPGGVIIHTVPEETRSRWSHIEDLDSFFKNVYTYHQKHGFQVMLVQVNRIIILCILVMCQNLICIMWFEFYQLQKISELLQVVFILFLSVYLCDCVNYQKLFNNLPEQKALNQKVTLNDVLSPPGECMTKFSFGVRNHF